MGGAHCKAISSGSLRKSYCRGEIRLVFWNIELLGESVASTVIPNPGTNSRLTKRNLGGPNLLSVTLKTQVCADLTKNRA